MKLELDLAGNMGILFVQMQGQLDRCMGALFPRSRNSGTGNGKRREFEFQLVCLVRPLLINRKNPNKNKNLT